MQAIQSINVDIPMPFYSIVDNYQNYGFANHNELITYALQLFVKEKNEQQLLIQSANLYAEIYSTDNELQDLTETAINDWE